MKSPLRTSVPASLILGGLLFLPPARAQDAFAYKLRAESPDDPQITSAALSATVTTSPATITLQWQPQPAEKAAIRRRPLGATNWTVLASGETGSTYADTQITAATRYEYQVGDRYLLSAVRAAPVEDRGRVILLVDETVANPLRTELAQLAEDLVGDGWKVIRHNVPRFDDTDWNKDPEKITWVKSQVVADYIEAPAATKAIYLIGRVPIPYSGMVNPDGHGWRTWPVDGFYGDTVSEKPWTDVDNNVYSTPPNVPGDGKYDPSAYPTRVELAVGRIDFAYLPAFARNLPPGVAPLTEVDLLRRYLTKAHRFRLKQTRYADTAVAVGNFIGSKAPLNQLLYLNAVRNGTRCFGANPTQILPGNLFTQKSPLLWGFQCGYGGVDRINDGSPAVVTSSQMADPAKEPAVAFYVLDGSYFGDWNQQDSLIRAVLGTPNYGLGSLWARNHPLRFEPTGLGETVGAGWLHTINELLDVKYITTIYLAWQGDPTLRLQVVDPPGRLTGRHAANNQVTLDWNRAEESAARYWVYRSTRGLDGPFLKLNDQPIEDHRFVDRSPPVGDKLYQVRTVVLTTTGSGSYTNLSQAAFVTVSNGLATDPRLWLVADQGLDTNAASRVTAWRDQSGQGLDLAQADPAFQPFLKTNALNGRPVVQFDGENDFLSRTDVVASRLFSSNEATIFVVQRQDGTKAWNTILAWQVSQPYNRVITHLSWDDQLFFDHGNNYSGGRVSGPQPAGWDDRFHLVEAMRRASGTATIRVDGVQVAIGPMTSPLNVALRSTLYLGGFGPQDGLKGELAEVRVYDRALNESERGSAEQELLQKYGLALAPKLWLVADRGLETDPANRVTVWRDQSGHGLDLAQANPVSQPILRTGLFGGRPVVQFDGENDFLSRTNVVASSLFSSNETTIYVVQRQDGTQAWNTTLAWEAPQLVNRVVLHLSWDDQLYFDHGNNYSGGRIGGPQPAGWDDRFHLVEAMRNVDGTATIRVDGATVVSGLMTSPLNVALRSTLSLGGFGPENGLRGEIAEVRVYDRALNESERRQMEQELLRK